MKINFMHNYKELEVWKKAIETSISVYKLARTFPAKDQYILSSQISRAAISIPSNIAEGAGKATDKDFCRYISISQGSSFELETQLLISKEVLPENKESIENILKDLTIIQKMLFRLRMKYKSE